MSLAKMTLESQSATLTFSETYLERQTAFVEVLAQHPSIQLRFVTRQSFVDWDDLRTDQRRALIESIAANLAATSRYAVGIFHFTDTERFGDEGLGQAMDPRARYAVEAYRAVKSKCDKVIFYTGGVPKGASWIARSVSGGKDVLHRRELDDLIEWVESGYDERRLPAFLESRSREILPALSILCQGYIAVWASGQTPEEAQGRERQTHGAALWIAWDGARSISHCCRRV